MINRPPADYSVYFIKELGATDRLMILYEPIAGATQDQLVINNVDTRSYGIHEGKIYFHAAIEVPSTYSGPKLLYSSVYIERFGRDFDSLILLSPFFGRIKQCQRYMKNRYQNFECKRSYIILCIVH